VVVSDKEQEVGGSDAFLWWALAQRLPTRDCPLQCSVFYFFCVKNCPKID
jgi:hypothetical protein